MTAKTGATIVTDVVSSRVEEIRHAFPSITIEWCQPHSAGIFRRIAIANIESDFAKYRTNLILLGHQMAIQCEGIALALTRGIRRVISGFAGYQAGEYMEQMPIAISVSRRLFKAYDLTFETPIAGYESLDDVKFQLLDFGVTTKSLEAVSLFADSFSAPIEGAVEDYMMSKMQTCAAYIKLKTGIEADLNI